MDRFATALLRLGPERRAPAGGEALAPAQARPAVRVAPCKPDALVDAFADPLGRAATAAAYLRLAGTGAQRDLAALEDALDELRRRVAVVAGAEACADGGGRADLARLVGEALASLPPRAAARYRRALEPAAVRIDAARARAAIREALLALARAAPVAGSLRVSVARRGDVAALELASETGGGDGGARALLETALAPWGARLELEPAGAHGRTLRVSFPLATSV
ncbi:MAG: hypothetical protein QM704_19030 [Anaeromyxobacteraceae bacterium]